MSTNISINDLLRINGIFRKKAVLMIVLVGLVQGGMFAQVIPDSSKVQPDSLQTIATDSSQNQQTPPPAFFAPPGAPPMSGGPGDSVASPPVNSARQAYIDSIKATSDLQAPVDYKAVDSIIFDVKSGMLFLYEQAELTYDEIELKAKRVRIDMDGQTLYANGVENEKGKLEGRPKFKQGEQEYLAKNVAYNFKSQKGKIRDGRMIQGEGYVIADEAKYHEDGSFHGKDGKYTTCNLEHPHYFIQSRKMKILPNKRLISGPLNLVIGDFPIPIVIPFAFVPNMDQPSKQTGLLMPQYGNADDRGFFLRGLGYYFDINDFFDLRLEGDLYTRGGWRLGASTTYRVRYKYSGSFAFQYGVQTFNEKTDPDYTRKAAWSVRWSHNQPIDPTARLNASVNISSSNSFQREISYNQSDFFTNNLSSSVSFAKSFNNLPFNLNVSARHQQDLNKETMSMELPQFSLNMNRLTPFRGVSGKNMNWLKQLGMTYNMEGRNSVERIPDTLLADVLLRPNDSIDILDIVGTDTAIVRIRPGSFYSNGIRQRAAASTTIKALKYINISPSFSYNEYWYSETLRRTLNEETNKIEDETIPGFERAYDFTTSVSASTNFFGIYALTKSKRDLTFRQRFTPSVSYNLRPDFSEDRWGYYETIRRDTLTDQTLTYSRYQNNIYRGPTAGESQSIGFNLSSVIEMKYKAKEQEEEEDLEEGEEGEGGLNNRRNTQNRKKVGKDGYVRTNVIDNIGLSTSYNFAADSFQLAPLTLRARTSLLNRKININTSATMDPYVYGVKDVPSPFDPGSERRQNRLLFTETGQLARLTRAQISLSTSLRSQQQRGREKGQGFSEQEYRHASEFYEEYVDFSIPWSLNLRYNLSYNKTTFDPARITQTVNLSGDFNFTQNWKISFNSGYDIQKFAFTQTSVNVHRDLHCWQMAFRWIPFGPQKSYSVVISAKSSTLSMLRLSKNDFWQDRFR